MDQQAVRVKRTDAGTYEIIGEPENWDAVVANATEPPQPQGDLIGWGPYSSAWTVVTDDGTYTYFVTA